MSDSSETSPATARPISTDTAQIVPPQVSNLILWIAAVGFALWGLAWIVLIPNHSSRLGWILQTAGPLIIAAAIIMFTESLVKRVGPIVVFFAAVGAICAGLSTLFFAIDPTNLALEGHVRFGYGGYAVGALLGAIALALVIARTERELTAAGSRPSPPCPSSRQWQATQCTPCCARCLGDRPPRGAGPRESFVVFSPANRQ